MMKRFQITGFLLLFSLFWISLVSGQQVLEVAGVVTEQTTGEPLPGANVAIKGTNLGTATDRDGAFRIRLPNFTEATLVVSFIGYKTQEVTVRESRSDLVIAMEEDVLKVSEVVVTGLATSLKKRSLANSVGTISDEELVPAPAQTLERALSGKVAGLTISQNTGAPGGGINVNLRGISTITGSTQPLYVVDGVIVSNVEIQSGIDLVSEATVAGSSRPQGQPTNRIADINPNDIERIEVLKGASAAAIYGSKATNGVVIITTKSGTVGRTQFDFTQQIGFSSILKKIGIRRFTLQTAEQQYGDLGREEFLKTGGRFIDQEEVLFGENGLVSETTMSVRGGNERTQFYVSGLIQDEDGIVKYTGYQKYSGKVNLNHRISDRLKISAFTTFARSESQRSITGNDNTNTTLGFSMGFTPSFIDLEPKDGVYPVNPFNPSNPVETRDLLRNREKIFRTIASMRLDWSLVRSQSQTLDFIAVGGVDFFAGTHEVISPPELQFERDSGLPGESVRGETSNLFSNLYLNLTHSFTTRGNTVFRTTAGIQFENRKIDNLLNDANGLIPTQTNVDQAASVEVFQTIEKQRERGFFIQEEIDFNEKIYLSGALRGDASSANGNTDKFFLFPKVAGSIRLSQYGFWEGLRGLLPEFKLRAAYGETGNLPRAGAKFTNLIRSNIGGRSGLVPAALKGDPNIKPERTKEIEVGFDATLFNGNGVLEFSFYNQNIDDLILQASLPPSSGFSAIETNAGSMRTQGWEVSLGLTPIRAQRLNWTTRFNFFTTNSKITKLNVDPFNLGGFALFLGTMRIQEGYAPTSIVGAETVFKEDGTIENILGDQNPDFTLAWNNNINFGNFSLNFLFDWQQGGDVINLGKLIMDLGGTSPDFEEEIVIKLPDGSEAKGPAGPTRLTVLGQVTAPYIEDATYLKLRELALSYTFPRSVLDGMFGGQLRYLRLGVAGRNLFMWTGYDGYDPEVSQFGNVAIGRSVDTLPFPSSRQVYFNLAFGF